MVKSYLTDKGINYTEYDVASDVEARQRMVEKTSQLGVPTIEINGDIVVGFNRARLDELLAA